MKEFDFYAIWKPVVKTPDLYSNAKKPFVRNLLYVGYIRSQAIFVDSEYHMESSHYAFAFLT